MKKHLQKLVTATVATAIVSGPVYFTLESHKANAETMQEVDKETQQRKKLGNDLLKAIEETKGDINDPKATAQLKGQVTNYKNGVANRGKATIAAKAGAKALRATVHRIGKKAWNKYVKKIESMSGRKLVMLHYQGINKFCDILTGFEGNLSDAIAKTLNKYTGLNKNVGYVVARALIALLL